jgi:hypothetical protein
MAIRDAGGIEQLVALLHEQPIGEAATKAAGALKHLAFAYSANREAIREAGGIEPLVALLELRRDAEEDVMIIAGALWNLGYNNPSNQDAIREAGGVRCARLSPAPPFGFPLRRCGRPPRRSGRPPRRYGRPPRRSGRPPCAVPLLLTTALLTTALLTHSPRARVLARRAHHGAARYLEGHLMPGLACTCSPRRRFPTGT